jgi:hypothetical protein
MFRLVSSLSIVSIMAVSIAGGCNAPASAKKQNKAGKAPSSDAQNQGSGQDGKPDSGSESANTNAGGGDAVIYVANFSAEDVCFVYYGDGAGNWSDDLLGENTLPVDYYLTINGVAAGAFEIYAEGCNGSDWYGSGEVASEYTLLLTGGSSDTGDTYDTGTWETGR